MASTPWLWGGHKTGASQPPGDAARIPAGRTGRAGGWGGREADGVPGTQTAIGQFGWTPHPRTGGEAGMGVGVFWGWGGNGDFYCSF